jgi:hypothetical protein
MDDFFRWHPFYFLLEFLDLLNFNVSFRCSACILFMSLSFVLSLMSLLREKKLYVRQKVGNVERKKINYMFVDVIRDGV